MTQSFIRENEILLSENGRKFRLTFESEDEERVIIRAVEESQKTIFPFIYKRTLTIDEITKFRSDILIRNVRGFLKIINNSSKNNLLKFKITNESLVLSYTLYDEMEQLIIPHVYITDEPNIIYNLVSRISENTRLIDRIRQRYRLAAKSIKDLKSSKDKKNTQCIDYKSLFENLKSDIKSIINNFKSNIETMFKQQSAEISSINKNLNDNFNELKEKQASNSDNFSNLTSSINTIFTERLKEALQETNDKIEDLLKKKEIKTNLSLQEYQEINNISKLNYNKIKIINTIKTPHTDEIYSLCILADKRLVSASGDRMITIFNKLYEPSIYIKNAHDKPILSLYALKNGCLVSSSFDERIKVWKIDENDFQLIHILYGHTKSVNKVIELEDGKMCSCSWDKTIKIWDNNNNYQCIQTLVGHTDGINSVIETKDHIISASVYTDKTLRTWDKSKYAAIKVINNVYCSNTNGLVKLDDDRVISGGNNEFFIINTTTFEINPVKVDTLGWIYSFVVLRNGLVLFGNDKGEIYCYDTLYNQMLFKNNVHNGACYCLIKAENNKIISCSNEIIIMNVNLNMN